MFKIFYCLLLCIGAINMKEIKFWNRYNPTLEIYQPQPIRQCDCGLINKIPKPRANFRIINGTSVDDHRYPWLALLYYMNEFQCGGSLITDFYVLTAAHCMPDDFIKDELKIVLGEHNRCKANSDNIRLSVSDVIKHSSFNPITFAHDIMLLKVNMKVTFTKFIRPICLPEYDYYNKFVVGRYKGKEGKIVGWGATISTNLTSLSCTPRELIVPILSKDKCPKADDSLFCAGYLNGEGDSCQGDSGGPLQFLNKFYKYEIIGIVSSGKGCAVPGNPGLYTDILQNLVWIYKHITDSTCINYPIVPFFNLL